MDEYTFKRVRPSLEVTEEIHHGHFSLKDRAVNVSGFQLKMDKATYDALKNLISTEGAKDSATVAGTINIPEFDVKPEEPIK